MDQDDWGEPISSSTVQDFSTVSRSILFELKNCRMKAI